MKKVLVVISIFAVFAVLGLSISAAPIFNSNVDISLGLNDLDELSPEIQAAIEKDIEEELKGDKSEEPIVTSTEGPVVVEEESNDVQLALATETATLGDITVKVEPRNGGNYIVGYTTVSGTSPKLKINTATSKNIVGIAESAFRGLKTLTEVDLEGSTIKEIGMSAFYGCTALTTVKFPAGIQKIGGYAFINTPWLRTQRADANNSSLKNRLVIIQGILIDGIAAEGEVTVDSANGISSISPYAFSYNSKMTKLTLKGLPEASYRLCSSATGLQELVVENTAKLSGFSFFDCGELTTAKFDGVSIVDGSAFYACYKLADIDFGNELTRINNSAFMDCYALTDLTFPGTLLKIETSGFLNCKSIKSLMFNGSAGSIELGQGAFQNCVKLDAVSGDYVKTNGATFTYTTGGSKKVTFYNTKVEIPS